MKRSVHALLAVALAAPFPALAQLSDYPTRSIRIIVPLAAGGNSDYPHLSFADKVGSIQLWNLLGSWAPGESTHRRILVDNPRRLFGF